jgi:hypothetical protein
MSEIPPTLPFRLAEAYRTQAPASVAQAKSKTADRAPAASTAKAVALPRTLIANKVSMGIDFATATEATSTAARRAPAQPSPGTAVGQIEAKPLPAGFDDPLRPLQMYRHPADKNAAATAVEAGRRIDVKG